MALDEFVMTVLFFGVVGCVELEFVELEFPLLLDQICEL